MRTAILPFLFIFNTQLLLIGLTGPIHLTITIVTATVAMLVFAAASQGYFLVRSRWYETIALLAITFTLFRPGFWWDMLYPPFELVPPTELMQVVEEKPANARMRMWIEGETLEGRAVSRGVLLPLGPKAQAAQRLRQAGITVVRLGDDLRIANVGFGSQADKLGLAANFRITGIEVPVERPPKEWMAVPALLLLALIMFLQRRRLRSTAAAPSPA
jgi:hypothetical protein